MHTLAVRFDGSVWGWGLDDSGQLGTGSATASLVGRTLPVRAAVAGVFTRVAAGVGHSLALKSDGTVWAWGDNSSGQLGDGTTTRRLLAVPVAALSNVIAIGAQSDSSFALKSDQTVWSWGSGIFCGGGNTPMPLPGFIGMTAIAAGANFVLGLKNDGTVWACGDNLYGQLGDGTTVDRANAVQVAGLANVIAVAAAVAYSLALKTDGTVWAWGNNYSGQLGDGTTLSRTTPAQVIGLTGVAAISAGTDHALALKPDGSVYAWGGNTYGQLGTNIQFDNHTFPVQVLGPGGSGTVNLGLLDPTLFAPRSDAALSSLQVSNAIVINGIGAGTTLSVSGGEYSLGCTVNFNPEVA